MGDPPPPDPRPRLVRHPPRGSRPDSWSGGGHQLLPRQSARALLARSHRARRTAQFSPIAALSWTKHPGRDSPQARHPVTRYPSATPGRATHLRFNIFPDGGVARLRVFGEPIAPPELARGTSADLAALMNGGLVVGCSDMSFGRVQNLIYPGRSTHMGDGWETRRRRGPGHDWAIIRLAAPGLISRVEVDTDHFKGNAPESCSVEACHVPDCGTAIPGDDAIWRTVLPRTALAPDAHIELRDLAAGSRNACQDRQLSRRWHRADPPDRSRRSCDATLVPVERASGRGSGSRIPRLLRLVAMGGDAARRPPIREPRCTSPCSRRGLVGNGAGGLGRSIRRAPANRGAGRHRHRGHRVECMVGWRAARVRRSLPPPIRAELARSNTEYERRFGQVYIVCASGRTGEEILADLRSRLNNPPSGSWRSPPRSSTASPGCGSGN